VGRAPTGAPAAACEMTKWFDTNYHYLVPEFHRGQDFRLSDSKLFDETAEAQALGHAVKPVLLGPLSYLWLGKTKGEAFDKLDLLERLLPVYGAILQRLHEQGVEWVQMDEPILVLDLPQEWKSAFEAAYNRLQTPGMACRLPVAGLHIDGVRAPEQLTPVLDQLPAYKVLSVGVVDGRNVWRTDLDGALETLRTARQRLGERLWVAPSCSLLHVPVDLEQEKELDDELKSWLAFAVQKLDEVVVLKQALCGQNEVEVETKLSASRTALESRRNSSRIHSPAVRQRLPSARSRRPPRSARLAGSTGREPSASRSMSPACRPRSRWRWRNRSNWGWTSWCMANRSATTWWSISVKCWRDSPSPAMAGSSPTAPAASSPPSSSVT